MVVVDAELFRHEGVDDCSGARTQADGYAPLAVEKAGQCPYCRFCLERREVQIPRHHPREALFVYWGCTNEACSLMFWRLPRKPKDDEAMHH